MKFIECIQGSPEWLQERAGVITASNFSDALSVLKKASGDKVPGDPTAAAERYACDVALERVNGSPIGEPPKAWILERGHEMEAIARRLYEQRRGVMAMEAGIAKTDDDWFGYSTDGLVDDDGLIEIKAPVDSVKIRDMWLTGDVSEYHHQMQGGMWITGRKWCDFIMYVPALASVGKALYVKRIHRDDDFIADMERGLLKFRATVQQAEATFRSGAADDLLAA